MKDTLELFDACDAVAAWWAVSYQDGKIDARDLLQAAPLFIKLYQAAQGSQNIPGEVRAASSEDAKVLASRGVDLLQTALKALSGGKL